MGKSSSIKNRIGSGGGTVTKPKIGKTGPINSGSTKSSEGVQYPFMPKSYANADVKRKSHTPGVVQKNSRSVKTFGHLPRTSKKKIP